MDLTVYTETQQLSEGVWVFERGHKEWTDEMNRNMEIINEIYEYIKNHKTLTIKDENNVVLGTFDNTVDKEVIVKQLFVNDWDIVKSIRYVDGVLTITKLNDSKTDIDLQIPKIAEGVKEKLIINSIPYNGSEEETFELVEKDDVQNTNGHIPRYTEEGHLRLPSGIEIW